MIVRPSFLGPYRSGHPFEVFSVVARVYFRIEVVDTRIERKLFIRQFYPFPHIKQLALHVGFETGFEIVPSLFPFYVDQSAGEVAVFYRRDSPHDFYFGDVVGGDGTHVYPFAVLRPVSQLLEIYCILASLLRGTPSITNEVPNEVTS